MMKQLQGGPNIAARGPKVIAPVPGRKPPTGAKRPPQYVTLSPNRADSKDSAKGKDAPLVAGRKSGVIINEIPSADFFFNDSSDGVVIPGHLGMKGLTKALRIGGHGEEEEEEDEYSPRKQKKNCATARVGCLGMHQDVTSRAKASSKTSEIDMKQARAEYNMFWVTPAKPQKTHHLMFAFTEKLHLTEVNLLLPGIPEIAGPSMNPKAMQVLYCTDNNLSENNKSVWMPAKRLYIEPTWRHCQLAWRAEESAKFWKLEMTLSHENSTMFGISNVQLIAEDPRTRYIPLKEGAGLSTAKVATQFDQTNNLSPEAQDVRALAKSLGVDTLELDKVKKQFDRFDTDGSGLIDKEEFVGVLHAFIGGEEGDISEERFNGYWREVDQDGSGEVDFGEFLTWYQKILLSGGLTPENFYATFGSSRLRRQAGGEPEEENPGEKARANNMKGK